MEEEKTRVKNYLFEKIEEYIKTNTHIKLVNEYVINLVQEKLPNCSPIILNKFRNYAICMLNAKECKMIIVKELEHYKFNSINASKQD